MRYRRCANPECNKPILLRKSRTARYCSHECDRAVREAVIQARARRMNVMCQHCGAHVLKRKRETWEEYAERKYCGLACAGAAKPGKLLGPRFNRNYERMLEPSGQTFVQRYASANGYSLEEAAKILGVRHG